MPVVSKHILHKKRKANLSIDEQIRLWSIQYASNGIFNFYRENKGTVTEEAHQFQYMMPLLLDFFYDLKVNAFSNQLQTTIPKMNNCLGFSGRR